MIDLTQFVPIKEFPNYLINKNGDVYSTKSKKLIKPYKHGGKYDLQYLIAELWVQGKLFRKSVHQLVAITFIPNPNNYINIDHLDNNPRNNCVDNLEWVTNEENNKRKVNRWQINGGINYRKITKPKDRKSKKVTPDIVTLIRKTFEIIPEDKYKEFDKLFANALSMTEMNVFHIRTHKTWNL